MSTLRESEGRKRIERLHQGYPLLLSLGKRESNQGHSSASFFFAPTLPPKQKFCICFHGVHQPTSSDKPQLACYSTLNAHLGLEGKASESRAAPKSLKRLDRRGTIYSGRKMRRISRSIFTGWKGYSSTKAGKMFWFVCELQKKRCSLFYLFLLRLSSKVPFITPNEQKIKKDSSLSTRLETKRSTFSDLSLGLSSSWLFPAKCSQLKAREKEKG